MGLADSGQTPENALPSGSMPASWLSYATSTRSLWAITTQTSTLLGKSSSISENDLTRRPKPIDDGLSSGNHEIIPFYGRKIQVRELMWLQQCHKPIIFHGLVGIAAIKMVISWGMVHMTFLQPHYCHQILKGAQEWPDEPDGFEGADFFVQGVSLKRKKMKKVRKMERYPKW